MPALARRVVRSFFFFFSSRRRHTRSLCDWSSDVCSSDLHNGRHAKEERYYAKHGDHGGDYPIVVLINQNSASAAEIVTGALQDHDRALVMGQTSFGKGLVQKVFALSEGAGLLLTTSHYYTPSGRLIQRNYSNVSLYDYLYAPRQGPSPRVD